MRVETRLDTIHFSSTAGNYPGWFSSAWIKTAWINNNLVFSHSGFKTRSIKGYLKCGHGSDNSPRKREGTAPLFAKVCLFSISHPFVELFSCLGLCESHLPRGRRWPGIIYQDALLLWRKNVPLISREEGTFADTMLTWQMMDLQLNSVKQPLWGPKRVLTSLCIIRDLSLQGQAVPGVCKPRLAAITLLRYVGELGLTERAPSWELLGELPFWIWSLRVFTSAATARPLMPDGLGLKRSSASH